MKEARIAALVCAASLAACGTPSPPTRLAAGARSGEALISLHSGSTPFRLAGGLFSSDADTSNPLVATDAASRLLRAGPALGRADTSAGVRLAALSGAAVKAAPRRVRATRRAPRESGALEGADRIAEALTNLLIPVLGVVGRDLRDSFHSPRPGHVHDAIDIPAPVGTPVVAVADGTVLRKKWDRGGGRTIRIVDLTGKYLFYYAHLSGYAPGLNEGDTVRKGQVLGYVGRTGTVSGAHLHLRIGRLLDAPERWWRAKPLNPYPLLRDATPAPQVCVADKPIEGCPQ
ncbi:MAG: M23 family metallopeptidase [Gemmatimonadetes bacterium]|nr:M23 family metallopeptidase [Gemmatimonadota bacterium]